ncbi:hypothetical protein RQP46_001918 [Phenoliferia psychrophenolica]
MSQYATFYDANAESERPVALPSAAPIVLSPNTTLQPPLSRRGTGPGLLVIVPEAPTAAPPAGWKTPLDPSPLLKWAEEGYCVLHMVVSDEAGSWGLAKVLEEGLKAMGSLPEFVEKAVGVVVYEPKVLAELAILLPKYPLVKALIGYTVSETPFAVPTLLHLPTSASPESTSVKSFTYDTPSSYFSLPTFPVEYNGTHASISHSRSLEFLKSPGAVAGPTFDLGAIWEEHTFYEFGDRSVAKTMGTMVAEPYVNHIPTITGGIGRKALAEFYEKHFIFSNPPDTEMELISRVIGIDRICEEFIMHFTHTTVVDWLAPGVPPTGKKLEIPMMAVVCVRGDRLFHEHITWDQGTVFTQMGLMPIWVPIPGSEGKKEVRLPVAGAETATKLRDKDLWPSNELLGSAFGVRETQ